MWNVIAKGTTKETIAVIQVHKHKSQISGAVKAGDQEKKIRKSSKLGFTTTW